MDDRRYDRLGRNGKYPCRALVRIALLAVCLGGWQGASAVHLKLNCGVTSNGPGDWDMGNGYVSGGSNYDFTVNGAPSATVSGVINAAPQEVYDACRHKEHSYSIPVSDGTYCLRFHFYDGHNSDKRAMDYTVEGQLIIDDFCIAEAAGWETKAVVIDCTITVADGNGMQIVAGTGSGNDVFECGLEIITISDNYPPALQSATASLDSYQVVAVFDEPLEKTSAQNALYYDIDQGVAVSSAVLETDSQTVTLGLSSSTPLDEGLEYTLSVAGVEDVYGNAISSTDPEVTTFRFWANPPVRIMPLGNSITYDNYSGDSRPEGERISYRYRLYRLLNDAGYSYEFVGHEYAGYDFFDPDTVQAHNAGIPGIRDDELAYLLQTGYQQCGWENGPKQICEGPYLDHYPADILLLHIGTNGLNTSAADVESILDEVDAYESRSGETVTVVLSRIVNRASYSSTTTTFNNNVESMARSRIDAGDRIVIVDMEDGAGIDYDYATDMIDDLHPSQPGYDKMALLWHKALVPLLERPDGPCVFVKSPVESTLVDYGQDIPIEAEVFALDNTINKVDFYADGVWLGEDNSRPYTATLSGAERGWHSLTATVTYNTSSTMRSTSTTVGVPWRIMPLGNSITEAKQGTAGDVGYKCWLYDSLRSSGIPVDYVGSRFGVFTAHSGEFDTSDCPCYGFDQDHEGHWGWETNEILYGAKDWYGYGDSLSVWGRDYMPDVVLLHLGTNDLNRSHGVPGTIDELGAVIDTLREANPDVAVLLAQLIPSTKSSLNTDVDDLNALIPDLARSKSTCASPVEVVDQNTGFATGWLYDEYHPNTTGEKEMASRWFRHLRHMPSAPVAQAGVDQTVEAVETVSLDGSGSSDADGDDLTYLWRQIWGSSVTLSDTAAAQPTFEASEAFTAEGAALLRFELTVSDSFWIAKDTTTITVNQLTGWAVFADRTNDGNNGDVYRCQFGGSPEKIYNGGDAAHACWSATGKYVYFVKGCGEVWRISNNGADPSMLRSGVNTSYCPIGPYRPDDEYVLYMQGKNLYRLDGGTGDTTALFHGSQNWEGEIAVSAAGDRLAGRSSHDLFKVVPGGSATMYAENLCSASISPNGELLTQNVGGHVLLNIHSWNGGILTTLDAPDCGGCQWDNQKFVLNSNHYVVWMLNAGGPQIGLVHVPSNANTTVCARSADYPDFMLGNLPQSTVPVVAITQPADGASFTAGTDIAISADVTDGTVTKVEFYEGSTKLGEDLSSPYSYLWENVSQGAYTLTAVGTYSNGTETSTSETVQITVDLQAPTIDFAADQTLGTHPLTVGFTATNSGGSVSSWAWDFGDGHTSAEENPSHEYVDPGAYTVSLTATGPGGTDTETKMDYIISPWRIMPLGDSNTRGKGGNCYRTKLRDDLIADGYPALALDYVGTDTTVGGAHGPGPGIDVDYTSEQIASLGGDLEHEGWGGYVIDGTGIGSNGVAENVDTWLDATPADIIILMIGTNDIAASTGVDMTARLSACIDSIASHGSFGSPNYLVVATIPPVSGDDAGNDMAVSYNRTIPSVVADKVQAGHNVSFVDFFYAIDRNLDMMDTYHPNEAGYDKIGDAFYGVMHSPMAGNNPPAVVIDTMLDSSYHACGGDIAIAARAYDSDGTVSKVEFYLDGALVGEDSYGADGWSYVLSSISCGEHFVEAQASDEDDYTTVSPAVTLYAQNAPVMAAVGDKSTFEDQLLYFEVSASDIDGDPLALSAPDLPTGAAFTDSGDGTGGFGWKPAYENSGTYEVHFIAHDGHLSDTETVVITVQDVNRSPEVAGPADQHVDEAQMLSFDVSASDPDNDHLSLTMIDPPSGASYTDSGNGMLGFTWMPSYDQAGVYELVFMASDGYLTASDTVQVTVTNVDRAPVLTAIGNRSVAEAETLIFDISATDPDGDVPALSVSGMPGGASFSDHGDGSGRFSWTPGYDDSGEVNVTFTATHNSLSDQESIAIAVSNTNRAPSITTAALNTAIEDQLYSYDVDAADPDAGATLVFSLIASPEGMSIDAATGVVSWTPDNGDVGDTAVELRVIDNHGDSDAQSFTITVANSNDAPVISSTAPSSATEDQVYSYHVLASDVDAGDVLTYSLTSAPSDMSIDASAGTVSWTPGNDDVGSHTVTVEVTDGNGGNDTESYTLVVTNVNDAPVISSTAPSSATEDQVYSYHVQASDVDAGDVLTYSLTAAPSDMSIDASAGTVSWTPGNDDVGSHTVTVEVTDGNGGNDTESYTLLVANVNDAPVISSTAPSSATEDQVYSYHVQASDVDAGDVLTYSLTAAPSDMSIDASAGTVSWTPGNDDVGSHTVTVEVTDGNGGNDTESYTLLVANVNDAPSITSVPVTRATENALYEYDVDAVDQDADDILTYDVMSGPAEMSIDGATGVVSWTPRAGDIGTQQVAVRVTDSHGATAVQEFALEVGARTNVPPVLSTVADTQAVAGEPFSLVLSATDTDSGETLSFSLQSAPEGMAIGASEGTIEWTPDAGQAGDHRVIVEVADSRSATDVDTFTISVLVPVRVSRPHGPAEERRIAGGPVRLLATPNPATPGNKVYFALENAPAGRAALTVYDAVGNVIVHRSYDLPSPPWGSNQTVFGPLVLRDEYGRHVASGTYLVVVMLESKEGRRFHVRTKVGVKRR